MLIGTFKRKLESADPVSKQGFDSASSVWPQPHTGQMGTSTRGQGREKPGVRQWNGNGKLARRAGRCRIEDERKAGEVPYLGPLSRNGCLQCFHPHWDGRGAVLEPPEVRALSFAEVCSSAPTPFLACLFLSFCTQCSSCHQTL